MSEGLLTDGTSCDARIGSVVMALVAVVVGCASAWAQGTAALPQPDGVFYGIVVKQPGALPVTPTTVNWSVVGNNKSTTATNTTVVTVNTDTFYITRIPFETRQIVGGPALPATPDVLELTQADTTYTRSATVDGKAAVLPAGKGTFTYGASSQGLIERIDLVVGETYEEWSQRIFGSVVGEGDDADGDGRTNGEEWLQGTDPQDSGSLGIVRGLTPVAGGGFTITWDSQLARTYRIEKTQTLQEADWEVVDGPLPGTGGLMTYTHPAGPERRVFLRIRVSEAE